MRRKDDKAEPRRSAVTAQRSSLLVSLLLFACFLSIAFIPARAAHDLKSALLETGRATKVAVNDTSPDTIKIVSYNIRWRGGDDLQKLIGLLRDDAEIGGAAIIGLQEVDRNKKRTRHTNTAHVMAQDLGMHYAWAAPPQVESKERKEEETGVAILSPYPLTDVCRIVLPNKGPGGRRRVALGTTVKIGETNVRVYSVHAETRTSNERRLQQFQAVLDDLAQHTKTDRAVVLGDFNTIQGDDVRETTRLFTAASFHTPFPNGEPTWKMFIIKLKLDWIWLRGMSVIDYGIDRKIGLSDHWPLWVKLRLNEEE